MSPQGTRWYWFVVFIVRQIYLRIITGGLKVVGEENVPLEGPVILAPIHVSNMDPPVIAVACPRAVNFLAKEELFSPKILGKLIRSLGAFPVKRGVGDTSAIKLAISKLKDGCTLIMFPEGTRGDGKTLGEIQAGVAMLAKRSDAQVVVVGVCGTHKILPKGKSIPGFAKLTVAFGEPFTYAETATGDSQRENRALFAKELEKRLHAQCHSAGLKVRTASESETQEEPRSLGT